MKTVILIPSTREKNLSTCLRKIACFLHSQEILRQAQDDTEGEKILQLLFAEFILSKVEGLRMTKGKLASPACAGRMTNAVSEQSKGAVIEAVLAK